MAREPGPLLKQTATCYQWQVDSTNNYLNGGLVDLPASVIVYSLPLAGESAGDCPGDSSLKKRAESDYSYDRFTSCPKP